MISFLLLLAGGYFYHEKELSSISTAPPNEESMEPSNTYVERKSTFTYHDQEIQYLLIFPAKYTQMAERWPLILFLHGSSLRGQNLNLVKEYGPTWVAEQRTDFPCVVLAPQCPQEEDWLDKTELLAALLEDVFRKYRIDQDKVYLTGVSLGGRGTWQLAEQHPEYFAAIAPLAAAKPIIPSTWNQLMLSMPIWAFHGEKDKVAPLENDEALIRSLRKQGGSPRFTVLSGQGHAIAGVYKNQELYDWFLSNTRTSRQ